MNEISDKKNKKCWEKGKPKDCGVTDMPPLISRLSKKQFRFSIWYFLIVILILNLFNVFAPRVIQKTIDFSDFKIKILEGQIKRVEMGTQYYLGHQFTKKDLTNPDDPSNQNTQLNTPVFRTIPVNDLSFVPLLDSMNVEYYARSEERNRLIDFFFAWILPFILMIFIWRIIFKRIGNPGAGVMAFSQNKAKLVAEGDTGTSFNDVAGADEAKEELVEVVDFLKNPEKYISIGGKVPKGVLLVGPPGTGKTLLARAVAGEAKTPFFRMSGADFVEMFVGVGAARVRDLFKQAHEKAPCIIFIDELDAIGKSRAPVAGGNDEREQTLNQLLVEMDGFDAKSGVIILAATNRPEVLDPALLRPGRFDRQVLVDRPDLNGREAILKLHAKNVTLDEKIDFKTIARSTAGFAGADLANIVNEAALFAVRSGRKKVIQSDFDEAIEKTIAGLQKKNHLINKREREIVAYHETGHALTAAFTPGSDTVQKISIIPRGLGALGYTIQIPTEDRFLMTKQELLGKISVLLGGRAAEEIIFGEISTGAANDIEKATDIAKRMLTDYGMSEKFSNIILKYNKNPGFLGNSNSSGSREFSESTQQYIDEQIASIVNGQYSEVKNLLRDKIDLLNETARILLDKEMIEANEFKEIIAAEKQSNIDK